MTKATCASCLLLALCTCTPPPPARLQPEPPRTPAPLRLPVAVHAPPTKPAAKVEALAPGELLWSDIPWREVGGPWVQFRFKEESATPYSSRYSTPGPGQNPGWELTAPALPSISKDGARLLVPRVDGSLGSGPNLELEVVTIRTEKSTSLRVVLATATLERETSKASKAMIAAATEGERPNLVDGPLRVVAAKVGPRVKQRVLAVNEDLTRSADWGPLSTKCEVAPFRWWDLTPCESQIITCGDITIEFKSRGGKLRVSRRGKLVASTRWVEPPALDLQGNEMATIGCLARAHFDEKHKVLAAELITRCTFSGDWCYVPTRWRSLRLLR